MSASLPAVGWIGLGRIGAPMAQRVLEAGYPLRVWSRRPAAAQAIANHGAISVARLETIAQQSDVLVTIVGGPDDVLEVHRKLLPGVRPGTLVLEMSTASPATALALQELAAPVRALLLDGPVTGGVAGARQGKLTTFIGGDADALARCRPLLDVLSQRVVHCGPAGAGYRMKLVNQTMIAGTLLGLAEGAALARDSGFDGALVMDALAEGTASGVLFRSYLPRMVAPGGEVTFTLGMFRKDLRLAREELLLRSGHAPLVNFALAAVDRACERFGAEAGVQMLAAAELRYN